MKQGLAQVCGSFVKSNAIYMFEAKNCFANIHVRSMLGQHTSLKQKTVLPTELCEAKDCRPWPAHGLHGTQLLQPRLWNINDCLDKALDLYTHPPTQKPVVRSAPSVGIWDLSRVLDFSCGSCPLFSGVACC